VCSLGAKGINQRLEAPFHTFSCTFSFTLASSAVPTLRYLSERLLLRLVECLYILCIIKFIIIIIIIYLFIIIIICDKCQVLYRL